MSILKEEQVFVGTSTKVHIYTNCKNPGHSIEMCWAKGDGQEGQGPRQKKRKELKKKKKGKSKMNIAEEPLMKEMKALSHSSRIDQKLLSF